MNSNDDDSRRGWVAGLLAVIPGLGQLYNGQWQKAVLFFIANLLVQSALILFATSLKMAPVNVAVALGLIVLMRIYFIVDAVFVAKNIGSSYQLKPYNRWYAYAVIIILGRLVAIAYARHQPLSQLSTLPSGAMEDTLLIGDCLAVNKIAYGIPIPFTSGRLFSTAVRRGDVVVFETPPSAIVDPVEKAHNVRKDFVKRVIGLPGDEVLIKNKQVYLNGNLYKEPYAVYKDPAIYPVESLSMTKDQYQANWEHGKLADYRRQQIGDNFGPVKVPPDTYLILGDNRDGSFDSRYFGPVAIGYFRGKVSTIFWSIDRKNHVFRWDRMGKTIQ